MTNQWPGGFGANVDVTNLGDPVNGWTLTWTFTAGQTVTQAWNATVTQSGGQVTATTPATTRAIATGAHRVVRLQRHRGPAATRRRPSSPSTASPAPACTADPTPPHRRPTTHLATAVHRHRPPPAAGQRASRWRTSPRPDQRPVRQRQPGLLAAARHRRRRASASTSTAARTKVNASPITNSHQLPRQRAPRPTRRYTVRAVVGGVEQAASARVAAVRQRLPRRADQSAGRRARRATLRPTTPRVGDLDGDGQYEIVLKWDPSNAKDNSQSGYTGNVYVDAYRLDGTRLWRIDLGRNIRAGAHYTQFQVYDYDGDGRPRSP